MVTQPVQSISIPMIYSSIVYGGNRTARASRLTALLLSLSVSSAISGIKTLPHGRPFYFGIVHSCGSANGGPSGDRVCYVPMLLLYSRVVCLYVCVLACTRRRFEPKHTIYIKLEPAVCSKQDRKINDVHKMIDIYRGHRDSSFNAFAFALYRLFPHRNTLYFDS